MRVIFFMDFDKGELHFVEMVLTNPAIYRESIFRVLTAPHEDEDSPMWADDSVSSCIESFSLFRADLHFWA